MVRFGFRSEGGKKMKIEEIRKGMKNREKNRLVQRKIEKMKTMESVLSG